jgi:hypothetical protein
MNYLHGNRSQKTVILILRENLKHHILDVYTRFKSVAVHY